MYLNAVPMTRFVLLALVGSLVGCGAAENQDAMNQTAKDWALSQHEVPSDEAKTGNEGCRVVAKSAPDANIPADPENTAVEAPKAPTQGVSIPPASDRMVTVIYKFEAGGVDARWPSDFQENRVRTTVEQFPESVWLKSANAIPCVKSFAGPGQFMCDFTREANAQRAPNCDARYGMNRWNGETGCAPVRLAVQGEKVVVTLERFVYEDPRLENPIVTR